MTHSITNVNNTSSVNRTWVRQEPAGVLLTWAGRTTRIRHDTSASQRSGHANRLRTATVDDTDRCVRCTTSSTSTQIEQGALGLRST
jgi:hypothetical protein